MRRLPQQHTNTPVTRERDRRSARRQTVLLSCCLLLAAGFVFAARQQIAAVQYGYKSEELRRQRDRLVEEHQRLRLELEANSSPARLEQAARELGLQPARAGQIGSGARDAELRAAREEAAAARSDTAERAGGRSASVVSSSARISPAAFVGSAGARATATRR